jgi:hypothetical protein
MGMVGEFPGLASLRRRVVRAPVNPLDKSTVVSIYPRRIDEVKHTIQPGRFIVEPGSYDKPSILVVGPSSWWREIDEEQPLLEIPVSSIQIAESIVRDYSNGLLACNMGDSMPGLFFLPGAVSLEMIKKDFKSMLDAALVKQRKWFAELVRIGDILWARSNGNPWSISELTRLAAQELNIKDKDWLKDFTTIEKVRCKACGAMRDPNYPVCQVCKNIDDPEMAKKMNLSFAS